MKKVNNAWRPTVMNENTLLKLEEAFKFSLTDEEACLEVWITTTPFYDYCAKNPKWRERKELLKKTPNIQAKKNWINEIKGGNYASSKEYLERKSRDEFSLKSEVDSTNTNNNFNTDLTSDQAKKLTPEEIEERRLFYINKK